jgi:hypothetical protein
MGAPDALSCHDAGDHHARPFGPARRQLPFLAILALAIGGVAYTNVSQRPLVVYWECLAIATGIVCVITHWPTVGAKQSRRGLMWTQGLHWLAILVTMNVMLFSHVQQVLPSLAASLVLLLLLGTGALLAGIHLASPQIGFLGLSLVLAVPAISWVKQSTLFLVLAAVFFVGLAIAFWSYWNDTGPSEPQLLESDMPNLTKISSEAADNARRDNQGFVPIADISKS